MYWCGFATLRKSRICCQLPARSSGTRSRSLLGATPSMVRSSITVPSESASQKISDALGGVAKPSARSANARTSPESASRRYFGKAAADLDDDEAAQLAAGLPNPARWHPGVSRPAYRRYVDSVRRRMDKAEFLRRLI